MTNNKKLIQVCPICGNPNFNVYKENKYLESIGSSNQYKCYNCGNIFILPLEIPKEKVNEIKVNKVTKEMRNIVKKNAHFPNGLFLVKFWWPLTGTFAIILDIALILYGSPFGFSQGNTFGFFSLFACLAIIVGHLILKKNFKHKWQWIDAKLK